MVRGGTARDAGSTVTLSAIKDRALSSFPKRIV